ncbi:MAG: CAP domain-containing protein [Gaiellaceae bacterium]
MRVNVGSSARFAVLVVAAASLATTSASAAVTPPLPEPLAGLTAPLFPPSNSPPSPSQQQSAAQTPSAASGATATRMLTALQRSVAAQINIVRRAYRLPRLSVSAQLTQAGQEHARELAVAGFFSHNWSDGTPFGSWIRRFYPVGNARSWRAGENLAWSATDVNAEQAVEMWLASPAHRHILLDKRWRQLGLGVVRADGARGIYAGQSVVILAAEFGLRR